MPETPYDTHHIVPVSIGGSDDARNIIRVPRQQHALYHQLFNNYHPSSIIRFLFSQIFPLCFHLQIDISKDPYLSFLKNFDEKMFHLWNKNNLNLIIENFEKIKAILPLEYNRKKKDKIIQFVDRLYNFCTYHHSYDWSASGLFQQICHWCKIEPSTEILNELKQIEKNKGR